MPPHIKGRPVEANPAGGSTTHLNVSSVRRLRRLPTRTRWCVKAEICLYTSKDNVWRVFVAEICLYTSKDNVWRQFVAEICLYTSKDNVWRQFAVTPWGTHPDRQRETVTPWGTHPDRQRETVTKPPPYPTSNPNLPLQVKGQPVEANLPLQIKGQSVEANLPPTRPFVHHPEFSPDASAVAQRAGYGGAASPILTGPRLRGPGRRTRTVRKGRSNLESESEAAPNRKRRPEIVRAMHRESGLLL